MFNTIEEVLEDLRQGKMVVVMDDEGRENEGDLLCAAQFITPEKINFLAKHARGLICVPMESSRLDELKLHPMRIDGNQEHLKDDTAWAISVDAAKGITTGISAADRAQSVKILIDPESKTKDFVTPGHLFPLRAKKGGVLVRAGHTEASVDLTHLAGLYPAGVICEIMNEDGSMARRDDLVEFCQKHHLKVITIADLIKFRRNHENLIKKEEVVQLPTEFGDFTLHAYSNKVNERIDFALVKGEITQNEPVLVRVHSQCGTGDVFFSKRCDCGSQLATAMHLIEQKGKSSNLKIYIIYRYLRAQTLPIVCFAYNKKLTENWCG